MQLSLAPGWIRDVARFNPVNWAVEAGREALGASVDWGLVGSRTGYLTGHAIVCAWFATRAFRAYQRSVCDLHSSGCPLLIPMSLVHRLGSMHQVVEYGGAGWVLEFRKIDEGYG
jgi:hypothetical protein